MKIKTKKIKFSVPKGMGDTSQWSTGRWPDYLEGAIVGEWDGSTMELSFSVDPDKLDEAAKRIAREAIETFFSDAFLVIDDNGIHLSMDEGSINVDDPLNEVLFSLSRDGVNRLIELLNEYAKQELDE